MGLHCHTCAIQSVRLVLHGMVLSQNFSPTNSFGGAPTPSIQTLTLEYPLFTFTNQEHRWLNHIYSWDRNSTWGCWRCIKQVQCVQCTIPAYFVWFLVSYNISWEFVVGGRCNASITDAGISCVVGGADNTLLIDHVISKLTWTPKEIRSSSSREKATNPVVLLNRLQVSDLRS